MSTIKTTNITHGSNSGTANLVLASDGKVTVPTLKLACPGMIINVAQAVKTDTAEEEVADGAMSSVLFSTNYAAQSSSNKLLIQACISCGCDTVEIYPILTVGGAATLIGDAASNRARVSTGQQVPNDGYMVNATINYLHSSPSTSSTAYGVAFKHGNNAQEKVTINKSWQDPDATYSGRGTSTITIFEILG